MNVRLKPTGGADVRSEKVSNQITTLLSTRLIQSPLGPKPM